MTRSSAQLLTLVPLLLVIGSRSPLASPQEGSGAEPDGHPAVQDRALPSDASLIQEYETPFVRLGDELRGRRPFDVLARFPFDELVVGTPDEGTRLEGLGVGGVVRHTLVEPRALSPEAYGAELDRLSRAGWKIVETQWRLVRFDGPTGTAPARSEIACTIHATNDERKKPRRAEIHARIEVEWSERKDEEGDPRAHRLEVVDVELLQRTGKPIFTEEEELDPRVLVGPEALQVHPVIARDIDSDGHLDLVLAGCNLIRRNRGEGRWVSEPFLRHFLPVLDPGLMADFTGDGVADFLAVHSDDRTLHLWEAEANGRFRRKPVRAADPPLAQPRVVTAGDADGDGDLDVFVGQYEPFDASDAPDSFHDANDGHPAYFFRNDGSGRFEDATEEVGLTRHRNRRTCSASFVDLDGDVDLDLVVVSDFAGIDVYENDGSGRFTEITEDVVGERSPFGRSHVLADFDLDGALDVFVTGLGAPFGPRPAATGAPGNGADVGALPRSTGRGNRMYLRRGDRYEEAAFGDRVDGTGWAWGCTAADFDNDGDRDLHVANGHESGESSRDFGSLFWSRYGRGGGTDSGTVDSADLAEALALVLDREISWNGYEPNALLMNDSGSDFHEVGFLMDVGQQDDTRAVLAEDFDADGLVDLFCSRLVHLDEGDVQVGHPMRNEHRGAKHWVGLRLSGAPGVSPIGATVVARVGDRTLLEPIVTGDSYAAQHAPAAHFGLGDDAKVDWIEVRWPNGEVTRIDGPAVDRWHAASPSGK